MKNINLLINKLGSNNQILVENVIKELVETGNPQVKPHLIRLLIESDNFNVKIAAALGLSDLKANEAIPYIMKLIKEEKNKDNRGTLLYALQFLDSGDILDDIVLFINEENFEVREMAMQIIESDNNTKNPEVIARAMQVLKNLLKNNKDIERQKYLKKAVILLS